MLPRKIGFGSYLSTRVYWADQLRNGQALFIKKQINEVVKAHVTLLIVLLSIDYRVIL